MAAALEDYKMTTTEERNPVGLGCHQVHPALALFQELEADLNPEDLQQLKILARDKLGDDINDITDFHKFFEALKKAFNGRYEDMVKFFKNIWSKQVGERYVNMGEDTLFQKLERCEKMILAEKQRMNMYGIQRDERFVGRQLELEKIGTFLDTPTPTITGVCICGMAGMGKTSVATEVCFRTSALPIKIDLRGKKILSDLYISILHGLSMCELEGTGEAESCEWSQQSEDVLQRRVHEKLGAIQQETILFVDNIDDVYANNHAEMLRVIQRILNIQNDKLKLMLTSRQKLVDIDEESGSTTFTLRMSEALLELELGYLSLADAKKLLHLYAEHKVIDNDDAREIVQLCKQCPLVVKMVGQSLNDVSVSVIRQRLLANDLGEAYQIEHCINEMFKALQPEACKKHLIQLSVFETAFDASMAMAVLDHTDSVERLMNNLKRSHIIEVHEDNNWDDLNEQSKSTTEEIDLKIQSSSKLQNHSDVKFSFHPLVLAFLLRKCEPGNSLEYFDIKKEAELRFLQYFMECIKNNLGRNLDKRSARAFAYIDNKKVHLQKCLRLIRDGSLEFQARDKKDIKFVHGLCKVRAFVGNRHEQIDFYHKMAEKKEEEGNQMFTFFLKTQEMLLHMMVQNTRSTTFLKGQLKTMLPNIEAVSVSEEPLKPLALAEYFNMMGNITMDSAKYEVEHTMEVPVLREALRYYDRALENYQQQSSSPVDIAQVANSKGCVYFQLQNYEESFKHHKEAYNILTNYVKNDMHTDIPNYLVNIGSVYQSWGNELVSRNEVEANNRFNQALGYYAKALQIDRQLGFPNELCEARRLRNKADLHRRLKQFSEAASDALRAFRLFQKNFQPPHTELTMTLHVMGFVQYSQGKHLRAAANNMLTEEAEQAFEKSEEYYGHVRRMIQTGGLLKSHHDYHRIKDIHQDVLEALGKFEDLIKIRKFYRDFEAGKFSSRISEIQRDMEGLSSSSDSASEHAESDHDEDYSAASSDEQMDQGGAVGGEIEHRGGRAWPPRRQDSGFDSIDLDASGGRFYEEFRGMAVAENVFDENPGGENPDMGNRAADPPQPVQQPRSREPVQRQASVPKKRKMTEDDENLL